MSSSSLYLNTPTLSFTTNLEVGLSKIDAFPKVLGPHPFGYLTLWNFSIFSCILNIYKNAQDSPITKTNKTKTKTIPPACAPVLLHAHFLLSFKVCFLKVYFICCFLLERLYPTTVGNVVSVLDESVLFMIIGVFLTGKSVGLYCLKSLWCYSIILCETELSRCYYDFCFSLGLLLMDLFESSSLWYWSSQGLSLIHCPMFVDAFYTITFV